MRINFRRGVRKSLTLADIPTGSHGLTVSHDQLKGLSMTTPVEPVVDTGRMSASAVINTDAVDYEDEVILASGVNVANYANNPVVMWDHGKSLTTLPIGTSRNPDGELDLERSEFTIESTTYFSQRFPLAYQIFGLIDEGVIRATSIHVVPTAMAAYVMEDGTQVMVTEESDMVEYSWCPFGVNPEALGAAKSLARYPERFREAWSLQADRAACVLDRGTVGSDALLPELRKSLTAMVPKPRHMLVNPFDKDSSDMSKKHYTTRELAKLSRPQLKSLSLDDLDEATVKRLKSLLDEEAEAKSWTDDDDQEKSGTDDEQEKCGMDRDDKSGLDDEDGKSGADFDDLERSAVEDEDEESVLKADTDSDIPLGAKVLKEAHDAVQYVVDYMADVLAPVENETVKSGLMSELKSLRDSVETIKGIYAEAYKSLEPLGTEQEKAKSGEATEQLKSMLATDQRRRYQLKGLQSTLAGVATAKNLTAAQRSRLSAVEESFDRLMKSAASFTPAPPKGYVPAADHQRLIKKFDALLEKVDRMVLPASE